MAARHQRPAQHDARRPRRVAARAAQARARPARVRRRRDRLRRADEGVGGGALGADGQPLPLRPARGGRPPDHRVGASSAANGRPCEQRPPLRVDVSYAVTAWTRAVEDEHRLLSQVLAILYAYPILPGRRARRHASANGIAALPARHARPRRAARRTRPTSGPSIGGQYKASLDYVVTLSCEPGTRSSAAPRCGRRRSGCATSDRARATIEELHRAGGVVRDADGEPVANAWVALPAAGLLGGDRRRRPLPLRPLEPGTLRCVARTRRRRRGEGEARGARARVPSSRSGAKAKAPSEAEVLTERGPAGSRCPNGCPPALWSRAPAKAESSSVCPPARGRRVCCSATSSR